MVKIIKDMIHANGIDIGIYTTDFDNEFISLTDIARYKNSEDPRFAIQNWMRNRNTIEFLGLWEILSNPNFNRVQFEAVRNEAGLKPPPRSIRSGDFLIILIIFFRKSF